MARYCIDAETLLHIVRSMKSTGKGACILPHGVLFRGNAEGPIRKQLVCCLPTSRQGGSTTPRRRPCTRA